MRHKCAFLLNEPRVLLLFPVEKVLKIVDECRLVQYVLLSQRREIEGICERLDELQFYLESSAIDGLGISRVVSDPWWLYEGLGVGIFGGRLQEISAVPIST